MGSITRTIAALEAQLADEQRERVAAQLEVVTTRAMAAVLLAAARPHLTLETS